MRTSRMLIAAACLAGLSVSAQASTWSASLTGPVSVEVGTPFEVIFTYSAAPAALAGWGQSGDVATLTYSLMVDGTDRALAFPLDTDSGGSHTLALTETGTGVFEIVAAGSIAYSGVRQELEEYDIFGEVCSASGCRYEVVATGTRFVMAPRSFGSFSFNETLSVEITAASTPPISTIPLPATGLLLLGAMGGLGVAARRRARA